MKHWWLGWTAIVSPFLQGSARTLEENLRSKAKCCSTDSPSRYTWPRVIQIIRFSSQSPTSFPITTHAVCQQVPWARPRDNANLHVLWNDNLATGNGPVMLDLQETWCQIWFKVSWRSCPYKIISNWYSESNGIFSVPMLLSVRELTTAEQAQQIWWWRWRLMNRRKSHTSCTSLRHSTLLIWGLCKSLSH